MTVTHRWITNPLPTMRDILKTPPSASADRSGAMSFVDKRTLPAKMRDLLALEDFEAAAKKILPHPIFGYVAGGVETNASLRGNRAVFDEIGFVPQSLVDTSARGQKTPLFGHTYNAPFGLAPMGGSSLAAYQGDEVLARAAAQANLPMIMSGACLTPMEKVRATGHTSWFQAYLPGDITLINECLDRCQKAGFDTLVVTVDVPVMANRENNVRNGYNTPLRPTLGLAWHCLLSPRWFFGNFLKTLWHQGMPHFENMGPRVPLISQHGVRGYGQRDRLQWGHIAHIRKHWKGNLVIKGIMSWQSARLAREHGVDGIIVSNHGGRQLDGTVSPLRVLPEIAAHAKGMSIIMDSGIRRGTDVLKALALGAHFVFIGRPFLFAATVGAEAAVAHAIKLLIDEIDRDMAMLGINQLSDLNASFLRPATGARFLTT